MGNQPHQLGLSIGSSGLTSCCEYSLPSTSRQHLFLACENVRRGRIRSGKRPCSWRGKGDLISPDLSAMKIARCAELAPWRHTACQQLLGRLDLVICPFVRLAHGDRSSPQTTRSRQPFQGHALPRSPVNHPLPTLKPGPYQPSNTGTTPDPAENSSRDTEAAPGTPAPCETAVT